MNAAQPQPVIKKEPISADDLKDLMRLVHLLYQQLSVDLSDYLVEQDKQKDENEQKDSFVYCVQDTSTGFIKIGKANDVERRLKGLQTGNGGLLRLLATKRFPSEQEALRFEKQLHSRFSYHKAPVGQKRKTEWFSSEIKEEACSLFSIGDKDQTATIIEGWLNSHPEVRRVCSAMLYEKALCRVGKMSREDSKHINSSMLLIDGWCKCEKKQRFKGYGTVFGFEKSKDNLIPSSEKTAKEQILDYLIKTGGESEVGALNQHLLRLGITSSTLRRSKERLINEGKLQYRTSGGGSTKKWFILLETKQREAS